MANDPRNTSVRPASMHLAALPTLSAASTAGAGTAFDLGGPYRTFGVYARRASTGASGGSTKAVVQLQGSIDGTNYFSLGASTTMTVNSTAGTAQLSTNTIPVMKVRGKLVSFTTSSSTNPDVVATSMWIVAHS